MSYSPDLLTIGAEGKRQVSTSFLCSRLVELTDALAVVLSSPAESIGKPELLPIAEELAKLAALVR